MSLARGALLYESVLEHLKSKLLSGEYSLGDQLPTIASLAAEFGVAPASVREAYRALERMGILEVTRGRGTFVRSSLVPLDGTDRRLELTSGYALADLLEFWRFVKPELAALAARRGTAAERQAILETATEMERIGQPCVEVAELDYRFDDLLFAAAGNPVATRIYHALADETLEIEAMTREVPGSVERRIRSHLLIARAIADGNSEAARVFMYQHVTEVESDLLVGDAEARALRAPAPVEAGV